MFTSLSMGAFINFMFFLAFGSYSRVNSASQAFCRSGRDEGKSFQEVGIHCTYLYVHISSTVVLVYIPVRTYIQYSSIGVHTCTYIYSVQ